MPAAGDLAQLSPARLYGLAALTSATGLLRLETEKGGSLRLSFRRGTPEHLASDDPELSLLRYLQSRKLVEPEKAAAAEEQATKGGQDIVSVLFQMQLIPPSDAAKVLGEYAVFLLDRGETGELRGEHVTGARSSPARGESSRLPEPRRRRTSRAASR